MIQNVLTQELFYVFQTDLNCYKPEDTNEDDTKKRILANIVVFLFNLYYGIGFRSKKRM